MEFRRLKNIRVEDYVGERLAISFRAFNVQEKDQKNGGKFLSLDMVDVGKRQRAVIFSVGPRMIDEITPGKAFDAILDVKPYREGYSCVISSIRESDEDTSSFIDWADDLSECYSSLSNAMNIIDKTIYGDITKEIVDLKWDKFSVWPAAKGIHHTQMGGLVVHTVGVLRAAIYLGQLYNQMYGDDFIDLSLLISAAILHDIGKTDELDVNIDLGEASYSADSCLRSHIMVALELVDEVAIRRGLMDTSEVRLLKHVIASHHGKLEWGSPIEPSIPEAILLHNVDMLDAVMSKSCKELNGLNSGQANSSWINGKITSYYKK